MSAMKTSVLHDASDFQIHEGYFSSIGRDSSSFTARDVHVTVNHHYTPSPTPSSQSGSSPILIEVSTAPAGQVSNETSSTGQSRGRVSTSEDIQFNPTFQNCDIYRNCLATKGRGFPLWIPEPSQRLPIQYQRNGISVGDVGVITNAGSFNFLFNIFLPNGHRINPPVMPEGFKPLQLVLGYDILVQRESKDDGYLASPSRLRAEKKEGNSNLIFKSSKSGGAILTMPFGAKKEELTSIARLRKYINANMANWYRYAYTFRGLEMQNGDLRVVYGCDKTSAWGMACLGLEDNQSGDSDPTSEAGAPRFHLEFGPTPNGRGRGGRYGWTYSGEVTEVRAGPDESEVAQLRESAAHEEAERQEDDPEYYENQCLFLRTMNAMLPEEGWKAFLLEQELEEEGEDTSEKDEANFDPRYSYRSTGYSGRHNRFFEDNSRAGTQRDDGDLLFLSSNEMNVFDPSDVLRTPVSRAHDILNIAEISSSVPSMMSLPDHPSTALNKFLLNNCSPGTTMAITFDHNWMSVVREDDAILPSSEELLERILKHHIICEEEGFVFFKLSPIEVGNTVTDPLDMRALFAAQFDVTSGRGTVRTEKPLSRHEQLFLGVLNQQFAGNFGPFVPQRMYNPHANSDHKRYSEETTHDAPIFFKTEHPYQDGITLKDALHSRTKSLVGRDELVFVDRGPSVSLHLEWPGYRSWSRQIPVQDFRSPPQPITLAKLAKSIAKTVQRFIQDNAHRPLEEDCDNWKVGFQHIELEDLVLVSLHHVALRSWQPHLRLIRPYGQVSAMSTRGPTSSELDSVQ